MCVSRVCLVRVLCVCVSCVSCVFCSLSLASHCRYSLLSLLDNASLMCASFPRSLPASHVSSTSELTSSLFSSPLFVTFSHSPLLSLSLRFSLSLTLRFSFTSLSLSLSVFCSLSFSLLSFSLPSPPPFPSSSLFLRLGSCFCSLPPLSLPPSLHQRTVFGEERLSPEVALAAAQCNHLLHRPGDHRHRSERRRERRSAERQQKG